MEQTSWEDAGLNRLALLQGQLLRARDQLDRAEHERRKLDGADERVSIAEAEIKRLKERERTLDEKAKHCRSELGADVDGSGELRAHFQCDVCGKDIGGGTRLHCFDLCYDFDTCQRCFESGGSATGGHPHFAQCRAKFCVAQPRVLPRW